MMTCLTSLEFWIQAAIHVGIVLFVLGSIALVQLTSNRHMRASSNGRASVLHTEGGSSILSVRTDKDKREMRYSANT